MMKGEIDVMKGGHHEGKDPLKKDRPRIEQIRRICTDLNEAPCSLGTNMSGFSVDLLVRRPKKLCAFASLREIKLYRCLLPLSSSQTCL